MIACTYLILWAVGGETMVSARSFRAAQLSGRVQKVFIFLAVSFFVEI